MPQALGLPSVAYCAAQLNISAKYFGDLVKKETGISAQEFIQDKVIQVAKEKVLEFVNPVVGQFEIMTSISH